MEKIYLETTAVFGRNGGLMPISFIWEDQTVQVKVLSVMTLASTKEGGAGYRYSCRAQSKQFFLFFDGERWYIES